MSEVVAVIADRLAATGMTSEIAERIGTLVARDLHRRGYCLVRGVQLNLIISELACLASSMHALADATHQLERIAQRPKDGL